MNPNVRLLCIGVGIRMFGNALYFPFLALFLRNVLGVSYLGIGLLFVGVGVIQLPFNYVGGLLTDRVGRRQLILVGLASEVATTFALAYAFWLRSLPGAIAAALVGGIIGTLAGPSFSAYIADFTEGSERTRGFTWYRIGFNAGYSAGVTVGGVLAAFVGFADAVAVAAVAIGAGTALMGLRLAPSPVDAALGGGRPRRVDGPSTAPPNAVRSSKESFGVLARDRVALELLVAVALAGLVAGQWVVTFPLYVHNILGVSYALLGAGLALNGLVVVFGQKLTTERVLGRRHTTIAIVGLSLYVAAFLGLGVSGALLFFPVAAFFVAVVVLTFGENLITIPQSTLPSNLAPLGEVGSYNGAFAMVGGAGFLGAVLLGGIILTLTANPWLIWLLLVLPAVPSIALFRHAGLRLSRTVDRA